MDRFIDGLMECLFMALFLVFMVMVTVAYGV
jgi:hypothetical protein